MKNQLLNLKMMALMCLMMVLGGANVWAQEAQTIFLETFGTNNIKKGSTKIASYSGYSATDVMFVTGNAKSNYSGDGSICRSSLSPDNLSSGYTDASGKSNCFNGQSGEHEIIKISNINIKSFNSLKLSFGVLGGIKSGHKIDVSYIIDGGEENALPSKDVTSTKWNLLTYDIPVTGSNLTLIFSHNPKTSWVIRVDDIKLTGVKAAGEPTYTKQTPVTFRAEDNGVYYATFSNDKVTFIPYAFCQPYTIVVSNGNIEKSVIKEESADINGKAVKGYFIPANTGVLLYSLAETADYYTVENKTVDALAEGTNMLMPAPVAGGEFTAKPGYKYYKLAYDNYEAWTGLGFYWGANDGGAFKVKAGTAYLAVPASDATAKGFAFNGEATGIEGVNANVENAKAIYNLNGQRVASMAKPGLYIVNGKKVVRK